MAADSSAAQAVEKPISLSQNGCLALLALLVLHRAKLLASNQSILALGVAPSGVRAAASHSAPARMPGVYAQGLCTMQSQPSIHSPSPRGRGLGLGIEDLLYFYKNRLFLQARRRIVPPLFSYPLGIFDEKTPPELQKSLTIPKLDSIII